MAGVENGDTASEVDIAPAFDVPDLGVFAALDENLVGVADTARNGSFAAGEKGGVVQVGVTLHGGSPCSAMAKISDPDGTVGAPLRG